MHLSSMTGFTRGQGSFSYQNKTYAWVWEIKSVNAKGLDVKTRIPQWLSGLDEEVKKLSLKVGDKILFKNYSTTKVNYEDEEYLVVSYKDILAVLD